MSAMRMARSWKSNSECPLCGDWRSHDTSLSREIRRGTGKSEVSITVMTSKELRILLYYD